MNLLVLIVVIVIVAGIVLAARARRSRSGDSHVGVDPLAGTRADPAHPGVAWMFPGRGTPTAQDVRETAVIEPDRHTKSQLPPGIKRDSDPS